MSFSNFLEQEILDHVFGNSAYSPPANFYIAFSSTLPTDGGSFTEITGSGYARAAVPNNGTNWQAASSGKENLLAIEFALAGGDWNSGSSFGYIGVYDASTGGNLLAYGSLTSARTVLAGQLISIPAGDLQITLD